MKKILFSLIALVAISQSTYAQWLSSGTNIYNSNTGNVGIGTTTPNAMLSFGIASINKKLFIYDSGTEGSGFGQGNSEFRIFGCSSGTNHISFGKYKLTGDLFTEQMRIDINGNVGIGTSTPTAPLNVQGGTTTTGLANIATTLTARFNTANPPVTLGIGYVSSDNPFLQAFNSTNSTANNLMLNPFGGNVVIGQSLQHNSAYMLDVLGPVRANSIVVNNTGADFVFEPSYKLTSLPTLEEYITRNHHLPEIASAKEMQANGVDLGKNQVKLLQKVEELTLYLIDKDKQISNEQAQLNEQRSQLKSQQDQIDQLKAMIQGQHK